MLTHKATVRYIAMTDKEVDAIVLGPHDVKFESGVYPVAIPQINKIIKVLIIHSSEVKENFPEGWYFSLETSSSRAWGYYDSAENAFKGALEMIAKENRSEFEESSPESFGVSSENKELH
jgi:hypothetical protein